MQVEGYVNGTFNLIKNLPEEVAGLPKNVSPLAHPTQARLSAVMHVYFCVDTQTSALRFCSSTQPGCILSVILAGLKAYAENGCCMQVSDAVASQQQNLNQAGNSTYLMESFHKLVHDLEEPLGVRPASPT